ncbi:hypothetical protein D9M70_360270 [compost metagenome]
MRGSGRASTPAGAACRALRQARRRCAAFPPAPPNACRARVPARGSRSRLRPRPMPAAAARPTIAPMLRPPAGHASAGVRREDGCRFHGGRRRGPPRRSSRDRERLPHRRCSGPVRCRAAARAHAGHTPPACQSRTGAASPRSVRGRSPAQPRVAARVRRRPGFRSGRSGRSAQNPPRVWLRRSNNDPPGAKWPAGGMAHPCEVRASAPAR